MQGRTRTSSDTDIFRARYRFDEGREALLTMSLDRPRILASPNVFSSCASLFSNGPGMNFILIGRTAKTWRSTYSGSYHWDFSSMRIYRLSRRQTVRPALPSFWVSSPASRSKYCSRFYHSRLRHDRPLHQYTRDRHRRRSLCLVDEAGLVWAIWLPSTLLSKT